MAQNMTLNDELKLASGNEKLGNTQFGALGPELPLISVLWTLGSSFMCYLGALDPELPLISVLWTLGSSFMCYLGAAAYLTVDYVFIKYRKTSFSNSFYTLAVSLSVPEILFLFTQIFFTIPTQLRTPKNVAHPLQWSTGLVTSYGWFVHSSHMLIICVNRFVAVALPTKYQRSFQHRNVLLMICASYVYGAVMVGVTYGCRCVFIFSSFGFSYVCNFVDDTCARFAMNLNKISSNTIVVAIIVIYVMIIFVHRKKTRSNSVTINAPTITNNNPNNNNKYNNNFQTSSSSQSQSRKKEFRLMVQFGIICIFLLANQTTFWVLTPMIRDEKVDPALANILMNTEQIVYYGFTPFLYMSFGSELKLKILGRKTWLKKEPTTMQITA